MRRIAWVVVGMAAIYSLLFVQAQLHRMGGAVIAPHLALELGLGTADLGLVIGVMFIASAASQPIAGVLLDRFGPVTAVTYMAPLAIVWTSIPGSESKTLTPTWVDRVLS